MTSYIAVILAVLGFAGFVAICAGALAVLYEEWKRPKFETADPYREGLDAVARISALSFEAERAMYVAAENAKPEEEN
jgi:hypothetical protein